MRRLVLLAALVISVVAAAPAAAQPAEGKVSLLSQSAWVGRGGTFDLRLDLDLPRRPGDLQLEVGVYPAVSSRSEFAVTLDNKSTASVLRTFTFPVSSLRPDPSGAVSVKIGLQDPNTARDTGRLSLGEDDGVHPVRVDLREKGGGGEVVQRLTTHLVHLPGDHPGAKLGMGLILPFHLPVTAEANDETDVPPTLGQSIDAARTLPVILAPTPDTLSGLASSSEGRAAEILAGLRRVAAERTVLNSSYVPVSLPALYSSGLQEDAASQVDRASATLTEVLRVQPDPRTWLSDDPLDATSLGALARRGVNRMIVSEAQLQPVSTQKLTLTESFVLEAGDNRMNAVVADGGLTAHFANQGDQVLRAHQLLADLAVLYMDRPGAEHRALVALPRRGWVPDRRFVETLAAGMNQNPLVEPVSLDVLFDSATSASSQASTGVVRRPARARNDLEDVASKLRTTRRRLDSLASVLGRDNRALAALERQQLMAESSELRSTRQREPYVEGVEDGIASTLDDIRLPEGRSITLTARRGEIPVTFQNRTGYPAQVIVKVESDKLDFPTGSSRSLDLSRPNTIERFDVVAKTSGAFPLRITLESPDGNLVIGQASLTVRSTAAAGVSLVVALGAAAFLALWWGRHALRGRRSRRLVNQ